MNHELIERYRDINVDGHWWDDTAREFIDELYRRTGVGIPLDSVRFSGFSSQGDGASFTINGELLADFLVRMKWDDRYPALAADENVTFTITRRHTSYMHEGTMRVEIDEPFIDDWEDDPFKRAIDEVRVQAAGEELERCETELTEFFRNEAKKLYRELESTYEYLTSDEVVWGTILANDLDQNKEEEEDAA
jgi:hypothetical protein